MAAATTAATADPPGRERSERRPETGHAPLPPLAEGLLHKLVLRGRVHPPEAALPRLVLGARHFQEVAVQGQVVPDRILDGREQNKEIDK